MPSFQTALRRLIGAVLHAPPADVARGLLERRWQAVLSARPDLVKEGILRELKMICDMDALPLETQQVQR